MKRSSSESAVDRLIALASDEKPGRAGNGAGAGFSGEQTDLEPIPVFADVRELEHSPMWKALLQFRSVVPYLARMMEVSQPMSGGNVPAELRQGMTDLQNAHRDLRLAVQDQVAHMNRLEQEMSRVREATERSALDHSETMDDMRSVHTLVKRTGVVLGVLMLAILGLLIFLLLRHPR